MSQELLTESAIRDRIVEHFHSYKDEEHKLPGVFFDELFYVNAILGNPIKIPAFALRPIKHLLKEQKNFRSVLHEAILKFSNSWHGYSTVRALDEEGRFKWQIV